MFKLPEERAALKLSSELSAPRTVVRGVEYSSATPSTRAKTTYFPPFFRLLPVFFEAPPPPSAQDTCFFVARGGDPGGINADFGEGGGCGTTMKARIVCGERLLQAPSGISPMTNPCSTQAFWNFDKVRAAFGVDASSETIKAFAFRCLANNDTRVCNKGAWSDAL